jgi:serine/threonine protein kinase
VAKVAAEVGSTANKYEILAKLATGGMADIFLARGESVAEVERYCVLKRILRERAGDAQLVQMFLEEARLAAQLQHPNIASVYDVGKLGDSYFFTMEYVHGETVRSLLQRASGLRRPVPLACALTIVAGTAAGLHHAHERNGNDGRPLGIVHRDVSPSNVMISYEGHVKVVDFGVAKASHRAVETKSGTVKGKINYLSPEQCRGERVDRRSDLFSLGIVMWETLTGRRLYRHDSDFGNMSAIVYDAAVPPSRVRPDVPREVDDLVLRLLAKPVADRFQAADEVVDEIESVAVRAGIMISAAAVGRFVRDLCGRRPEPWLELAPKPASDQPITVTNASIPSGVELEAANQIEAQLANLVELSLDSALVEIEDTSERKPAVAPTTGSLPPTVPRGLVRGGSPVELIVERPVVAPVPEAPLSDATGSAPESASQAMAIPDPPPVAEPDNLTADPEPAPSATAPLEAAPPEVVPPEVVPPEAALPEAAPQTTTGPHPSPAQHGSRLRSFDPYMPDTPRSLAKDRSRIAGSHRALSSADPATVTPTVTVTVTVTPTATATETAAATATTIVQAAPIVPPRRPGRLVALISAVLLAGTLAAWWTARSGDEDILLAIVPVHDALTQGAASAYLLPAADAPTPDAPPEDAPSLAPAPPQDAAPPVRRSGASAGPAEPAHRSAAPVPRPSPRAIVPVNTSLPDASPVDASVPAPALTDAVAPSVATNTPLEGLKLLYRDAKYADIIRTCASEITADLAELCARAACKEGQSERADSWLNLIRNKKARVTIGAACQQDLQSRAADLAPSPASPPPPPPSARP